MSLECAAVEEKAGNPEGLEPERIGGLLIGTLIGFDPFHRPLVTYARGSGGAALAAATTVDLGVDHVGRQVVLAFERGDPARPIVMGWLRNQPPAEPAPVNGHVEIEADGERLTVTAKRQLVLRCGRASITLTCSGKVLIDGAYISSRSSGVNRVKGGSVQLN